ncbi:general transcription factor 3C polypeptide 3 [Diprion similis]|uniref:general transcription factor 3C polypeptide 3 n=1 Tax=Diprion similis TaxID=362088 RepID=UPI001EF8271B|nr:general transcription factor 3C polypeptide 3 [Diprion similis]
MAEKKPATMIVGPRDSSSESEVIIESDTSLAPVIIEELDQNAITWMDVDMTEFVEAEALEIQEIGDDNNVINPEQKNETVTSKENLNPESTDDPEESDRFHVDEEDRLTKQFLNGELTFSEYSLRMDEGIETETPDIESNRRAFENELVASKKIGQKKAQKTLNTSQQKPNRRKKRTLPTALQGLMGEANLRFARGEVSLASQMCMEIIRQVPSAPEPFHTLAMIYENDQPEKSLQFALIAAHLSPRDADQWIKLATLSLESGNIRQTITCFTKAIQASPKDISLYKQRAKLQNQIGDKKGALKGYMKLLHHLGPEDGANILAYAKSLAKHFMQENNNEQALEAMDQLFTKCPDLITLEEVNVMTELLIALKQFHKCLDILTRYTSIKITYKDSRSIIKDEGDVTEENPIIESCELPNDVVMDLKAKFLITLVELNETKWTDAFLPRFLTEVDPEVSGDLFLDVAEALMGKKKFRKALQLLEPLIESKNFSLAAVWLRHAECWVGCKDLKRAVNSYEMVRQLSPQHLGARLELAKLYKLRGQFNKAIEVLKQDPETDLLDPGVVYQRTVLLLKVKRYNEYFQSGMLLLSRHCVSLRSKAELITLTKATGVKQRLDALQLYRMSRGETFEDENAPCFTVENQPSLRNEFSLFLQMCQLACKKKRYGLFQRLAFGAMTSKRFEKKSSHITFLCLISCIHNNDSYHGYNIVRELVRVCRRSNSWNLMNIIIQRAEDCRHNRFIMRLLGRVEAFSYLHVLHANNCLVSGTYKYALNDYVSLFKVGPSALLALLIAVTLLQMACQRFSVKKNQLVIQAIAFLTKYTQMRGKGGEQETSYNTARAFHQLGLLPAAVHHYKLVLESTPSSLVSQMPHLLDLKREAAFNLHLIYTNSENEDMARMYLEDYITV